MRVLVAGGKNLEIFCTPVAGLDSVIHLSNTAKRTPPAEPLKLLQPCDPQDSSCIHVRPTPPPQLRKPIRAAPENLSYLTGSGSTSSGLHSRGDERNSLIPRGSRSAGRSSNHRLQFFTSQKPDHSTTRRYSCATAAVQRTLSAGQSVTEPIRILCGGELQP